MDFREPYLVMYTAAAPDFVETANNMDNGDDEEGVDEDDAI